MMFSKMIFRKGPFFAESHEDWENEEHIAKLIKVLGTEQFKEYLKKFRI